MKLWMIYLSLNVFKSEARTLPGAKGSRPSGRRLLYGSTISNLGGKEGNPANISSWMCNIKMISMSVNILLHKYSISIKINRITWQTLSYQTVLFTIDKFIQIILIICKTLSYWTILCASVWLFWMIQIFGEKMSNCITPLQQTGSSRWSASFANNKVSCCPSCNSLAHPNDPDLTDITLDHPLCNISVHSVDLDHLQTKSLWTVHLDGLDLWKNIILAFLVYINFGAPPQYLGL